MGIEQFIENLLRKMCSDKRITDGIFKIRDKSHINILREYISLDIKDQAVVNEFIDKLIDESDASELAHKKGWEFKGGYWWDANGPIARTVDGQLKTLDQIEDEKRSIQRHKELERQKDDAALEREKAEEFQKRRSEKETDRIIKGIDSSDVPNIVQPEIAPIQTQPEIQAPEEDKATRLAKIRSKAYQLLNKEGKSLTFSSVLNNDQLIGFILESGKFVQPRSTEDPRYTLGDDSLKQEGWSEFASV